MRPSFPDLRRVVVTSLSVVLIAVGIAAAPPLLSAHAPATTLTIVNNTSRDISHVYLSLANDNTWGADLLDDSAVSPGASVSINNVSCPAAETRVVVEDQDGCFIYQVVTCGENATVTVTNESARDCGN